MTLFLTTALLALIQSLTEFLPISSSAHLILSDKFGLSDQTIGMDVALHVGTLLAVIIYFSKDLYYMVTRLFERGPDQKLAVNLLIATLPILCVGGIWGGDIIERFRIPVVIATTSAFYGLLLWIVDAYVRPKTELHALSWKEALCIGIAQVLALIPGTSRSGVTITCCRAFGLNRRDSAHFAMLLSIPTIIAAAGYILYLSAQQHTLSQFLQWPVLMGIGLSAVFGLLVIYILLSWLRIASFAVFAVYRFILAGLIVWYFLL